jgi:hypothetical protein
VAYDRGVPEPIATCLKDGVVWPVGSQAQVDWITEKTEGGRRHSGGRPWWIGYLDTGASDIVFWDAPKVTRYHEMMFPDDRYWLVSFLWDDGWACIGGSTDLISDVLSDPVLAPNVHRVDTQQDPTPPGDWAG